MIASTIKKVVFLLLINASLCIADDSVIGNTYLIIERDAEEELFEKINSTDWEKEILNHAKDPSDWAALKSEYLPLAQEDKIRSHVPFHTNEKDITDGKGNIIYPKGYTFNPLNFMHMPNKIWILTPSTIKYFKNQIPATDQVLIVNGNPIDYRELLSMPTFILDKKTKDRLGIKVAPSVVSQVGSSLHIREYSINNLETEQ